MKKQRIYGLAAMIMILGLSGCNETEAKETFRTVEYFNKNKEIRDQRLDECKEMKSMTQIIEKDCNNAKISFSDEKYERSRGGAVNWNKMPRRYKQDKI